MKMQQQQNSCAPQRDCIHFLRTGTCRFGPNCRFNHPELQDRHLAVDAGAQAAAGTLVRPKSELPERVGQPECQFYLKTGTCKFGAQCKYHHPQVKAGSGRGPPQLNFVGLPMRPGEKECVYYLRTGSCKFGVACKFHHPEPSTMSAVIPSVSPLYANNALVSPVPVPAWSLVRPAYLAGSAFPGASPFIPVFVSSPQNVPMAGWNPYQSPPTQISADGPNQVQAIQANGGGKPVTDDTFAFPQRPGQPDCHFYMKTGLCKFGVNCRYHHPKDVTVSLVPASMSPMGLPLRPGMPLCTFYLKNGICKFGPVCKFDHPIGYSSIPSVPLIIRKETTKADITANRLDSSPKVEEKISASLPLANGTCKPLEPTEVSLDNHSSITDGTED